MAMIKKKYHTPLYKKLRKLLKGDPETLKRLDDAVENYGIMARCQDIRDADNKMWQDLGL